MPYASVAPLRDANTSFSDVLEHVYFIRDGVLYPPGRQVGLEILIHLSDRHGVL